MSKTYEVQFTIDQSVRIKPLDCTGRVNAIFIDRHGIRYDIRYFDNSEAKFVYFFADELEEIPNVNS